MAGAVKGRKNNKRQYRTVESSKRLAKGNKGQKKAVKSSKRQ